MRPESQNWLKLQTEFSKEISKDPSLTLREFCVKRNVNSRTAYSHVKRKPLQEQKEIYQENFEKKVNEKVKENAEKDGINAGTVISNILRIHMRSVYNANNFLLSNTSFNSTKEAYDVLQNSSKILSDIFDKQGMMKPKAERNAKVQELLEELLKKDE